MGTVGEDYEFILANKGNYIRFGGNGIIDGLKEPPTKNECYEIIRDEAGSAEQANGLVLRKFGCKNFSLLPVFNFRQEFEIIEKKAFKDLPKY